VHCLQSFQNQNLLMNQDLERAFVCAPYSPYGGSPLHHRQWLNWQVDAGSHFQVSNMCLQLGNRLTYDVTSVQT
jgi:hypothetical protein